MNLFDIVDKPLFYDGIVSEDIEWEIHPVLPLTIYNYTKRCKTPELDCIRGLIIEEDGTVVTRPFLRFYQFDDYTFEDDTLIEVTEKVDGVLGILYPNPSQPTGFAISTRNSFTSIEAIHATQLYQRTHYGWNPRPGFSYLFEIVYPENHSVVNYGQDDCLYLVGIINTITGYSISVRHPHISIPRTPIYPWDHITDVYKHGKDHKRGLVIRDLSNDNRVVKEYDECT